MDWSWFVALFQTSGLVAIGALGTEGLRYVRASRKHGSDYRDELREDISRLRSDVEASDKQRKQDRRDWDTEVDTLRSKYRTLQDQHYDCERRGSQLAAEVGRLQQAVGLEVTSYEHGHEGPGRLCEVCAKVVLSTGAGRPGAAGAEAV